MSRPESVRKLTGMRIVPPVLLGISVGPGTVACVRNLTRILEDLGADYRVFDDGSQVESALLDGTIGFMFDVDLRDLVGAPTCERLTAAALRGIPQLVVPAGFAPSLPNDCMDELGKQIAWKVSAARGPTQLVLPAGIHSCLAKSLRLWLNPQLTLVESDLTLEENAFADLLVSRWRTMSGVERLSRDTMPSSPHGP